MTTLRVLLSRLVATLTGRRRDDELQDEIETHLSLLAEEHRRQGLSEAEARAAARRSFGGVAQTRDDWRRQRRLPSIDALWQDVRFGARRLFAERWSTAAAVGILALGIGSTVVMADMLDRLLLRPPDHIASPERVRRAYTNIEGSQPGALVTHYAAFEHLESGLKPEASYVTTFMREEIGFGRGPDASRFRAVTHSRSYFDVLGVSPRLGVLPSNDRQYRADTAVISHAIWQQRFGAREDVLGKPLRLGTRLYTIVAVTPAGFTGVDDEPTDVWLPIESRAEDGALFPGWKTEPVYAMLHILVRLGPDVDIRTAEARATTVYNAGPQLDWFDGKKRLSYVRLGELAPARKPGGTTEARISVWIAAVSSFVLLIACGNVGNLLFARGLRRGRELAVKTALGATRGRLFRELIVEATVLAVIAGVAALAVTAWGARAVRTLLLPESGLADAAVDVRLILETTVVVCVATLSLGVLPALSLVARAHLAPSRSIHRERPSLLLDGYVALQVALSVPLLAGAAIFGLSLWHARNVDFGMTTSRVAVIATNLVETGEASRSHSVHREMQAKLAQLPQVRQVAAVQIIPMRSASAYVYSIPGVKEMSGVVATYLNAVDPGFFQVMGMPIVAGRGFTDAENSVNGQPAVVVNRAMVRKYWPNESPLGRCIHVGGDTKPCAEIVGVVADSSMWATLEGTDRLAMFYVPIERYHDISSDRALLVQTSDPPSGLVDLLRRQAGSARPDLPYIQVSAFDDVFLPALRPLRLGTTVFLVFSTMALVIAGAGLAAVTASGVARRTREFGIRLALGANPVRLVRMVLRRSLAAAFVGLAAGALLSIAGERSLRSVLFGVGEGDYRVVAIAMATLAVVAAVAAWIPARRAGQVDPAVALRTD